jgi:hypothetical protein
VIIVEVGENPFKIERFVFRSYFLRAQRHKDGEKTREIPIGHRFASPLPVMILASSVVVSET